LNYEQKNMIESDATSFVDVKNKTHYICI